MTNRLDNLQIVFDRTDWRALQKQKRALVVAIQELKRPNTREELFSLLHWLDAMQAAAEMDSYQVKFLEQKESTR